MYENNKEKLKQDAKEYRLKNKESLILLLLKN